MLASNNGNNTSHEVATKAACNQRDGWSGRPCRDITNQGACSNEEWTHEQLHLLQTAVLKVEPTHPHFWQEVSRIVGRRASECVERTYAGVAGAAAPRKLPKACQALSQQTQHQLQQQKDRPAGAWKMTEAATRRKLQADSMWAQLQRLEISEEGAGGEEGGGEEVAEAVEHLQKQKRAHQYTTCILRRRGGWIRYQRDVGTHATDKGQQQQHHHQQHLQQEAGAAQRAADAGESAAGVMAALRKLGGREVDEDGEEQDDYFDLNEDADADDEAEQEGVDDDTRMAG